MYKTRARRIAQNALSIIENIANLCDAAMLPDMNTIINQIHTSLGAKINLINVRRKIKTQVFPTSTALDDLERRNTRELPVLFAGVPGLLQ